MTARIINRMLERGESIPDIRSGIINLPQDRYWRLDLNNNDSMVWKINVLSASTSPTITIDVYRIHDNGKVYTASQYVTWQWTSQIPVSLEAGSYIFSIKSNTEVSFNFDLGRSGFIQQYNPRPEFADGDLLVIRDFVIQKKIVEVECNEPLSYDLVEGELPPSLKLAKHDGVIYGIIDDMDCGPEGDSASFNWFYDNHDGISQAWAKVYRFKLRVHLRRDPAVYRDEWFCIKVYNNWTRDAERYVEEIQRAYELIETDGYTVSLDLSEVPEEMKHNPDAKCEVCQDPTMHYDEEVINIPEILDLRFPFELKEYFERNQNEPSKFILTLHNSRLFKDAIYHSPSDGRTRYEFSMTRTQVTIRKYKLEIRNFDDFDTKLIASRNIENQIREWSLNGHDGDSAVVIEWFW